MTAAVAGAAGSDLTALFVSVVPSFAGMGEAVKSGGAEAASGFTEGFAQDFHPFSAAQSGMQEGVNFFAQTGGAAAGAFVDAFGSIMKGDMPNLMGGFDLVEDAVGSLVDNSIGKIPFIGTAFAGVFDQISGTLDAFKGPAGEFLNQLIDMGVGWQDVNRKMAATTFDLGQIPELTGILRELGSEGLDNLDVATDAIGTLHARLSDLDPTQLKETTKAVASMSEVFGDVTINTDSLTGILNAFGISSDQTADTVNKLGNIAISTATPINELLGSMETGGASLRGFGYDIDQVGTILSNLNKEGIQVPKFLAATQQATSKFVKEGLTPEEGWSSLVGAVKDHLKEGTEEGTQAALELLRDYFPRAAPQMLEAFQKGLIDLPNYTNALEGIDRPLEEANDKTNTLKDALGGLKVQLDAALQPLTEGMANALTAAGGDISDWITTHQGEIVGFVSDALDTILVATFNSMKVMADIIMAVAPAFNPIIDAAVLMGKTVVGTVQEIASIARHLPGVGDEFAKIDDASGRIMYNLDQVQGIDVSKYAGEFGEKLDQLADKIPGVQEKLHGFMDPLEASANFSDAMKQNVTDAASGAESIKDMFETTPEGKFKLIGDPQQIAESKRRLSELGVDVTTGPDGIVTKVLAGNKKIQDDFAKWFEETTKKKLPIDVELKTQNQNSIDTLMEAAGIPSEYRGSEGVTLPMMLMPGVNPTPFGGIGAGAGLGITAGGGGGLGGYGALGMSAGAGGEPTSGGAEAWRPIVRRALMEVGPNYGITNLQAWEDDIVKQINTESGGNTQAINLTDSNAQAGHPSQGLMQFIPTTYEAHNISGLPYLSGQGQIYAAIDYVMKRYGMDPQGGPNFIGEGHGYQEGGGVQPIYPAPGQAGLIPINPAQKAAYEHGMYKKDAIPWLRKQQGGHAELPAFSDMQQPIPGEWKPGQDSVHGVLEVGEYVVRREQAQKHKALLDGINFGGVPFKTGGNVQLNTQGAQVNTIAIGYAVADQYGITDQGFYRTPDGYDEHSSGQAVDVMVGAVDNPIGDTITQFALTNASQFGVQYTIWANKLWYPSGKVEDYGSTGGVTDQHRDHVHIRTTGGGYPPGGGPGSAGAGKPHTGTTSSTPAPAAMQFAGAGGAGGMTFTPVAAGAGGAGGAGGSGGAAGLTGNYDVDRQNARMADLDAGIKDKQDAIVKNQAKVDEITADRAAKQAELDALLALPEGEQKLKAADIEKAKAAVATADNKLASATESLTNSRGALDKATRDRALEAEKPQTGAGGSGASNTDAQALGKGLVKGLFQELGFPDVFGKDPTQWGIWKLAMGGLGTIGGMFGQGKGGAAGAAGAAGGGGEGAFGAGGKGGGGGGDLVSSVLGPVMGSVGLPDTTHTGSGSPPGPAGVNSAMAPSETPVNQPVGAQSGPVGGPGVNINVNNNGVTSPEQFNSSVNNAMVDGSRQTATVGGNPAMQP